jgi:excinuclease ABC subunit C
MTETSPPQSPPSPVAAGPGALERIRREIRDWPTQPGVYVLRDGARRILYVGKAKNLRNRIRAYFVPDPETQPGKTRLLVRRVVEAEFTVTNTELDALLLECNLIKKHRPRFNIRLKDDKNFPYVVLDFTHPFPQFRITRKVTLSPALRYFGPFSGSVREISRFLAKTFQIRDCSEAKFKNRSRPCLNYEIGTCTAPCVGLVSQEDYAKQLREAILFLEGKKADLIAELTSEMRAASDAMAYERAKIARDKIQAIERLTMQQDAVDAGSAKDIDVVGRFVAGDDIQWVILFLRGGFLTGRRTVKTAVPVENVDDATRSFLEQFYLDSVPPDEIWLAEDFADRVSFAELLSMRAGRNVRVKVPREERALRLLGMAQENARLLFAEWKRKLAASASAQLKEVLRLPDEPHLIEGIDVSNFQGAQPAVAVVHFADERPLKSQYRSYHPKTVQGQDDFAMIHEVVKRRYGKPGAILPDLLLIDGGKGQLAAAVRALEEIGIELPVCSLAKSRTESGFTRKEVEKSEERIFVPNRKNPIVLKEGHPALRLLQQVRDEAHRFSVKMHRLRRESHAKGSWLDAVTGIGPKTKDKLLANFPTPDDLRAAPLEALAALGIAPSVAENLLRELFGGDDDEVTAKTERPHRDDEE